MWRFLDNWLNVDRDKRYSVPVVSLAEGRHEMDFVCGTGFFQDMENSDVTAADVAVHLVIVRRGDSYKCQFTFSGEISIPCDRCLEPMPHVVDEEYFLTVRFGEEYDDSADDVLILPYDTAVWDVSRILYDTILLTIPLRHVHKDGECDESMAGILRGISLEEDGGQKNQIPPAEG